MNVLVFKTEKEVDEYVGKHLVSFIQQKPDATIGFATGSTPQGTYAYLIQAYQQKEVDFHDVTAFNLDESVGIPKQHPRSFATAMKETLFDQINIQSENIHALDGNAEDMDKECQRYEDEIDTQPVDIQLLGIGMDGHIAYNEPGSPFDGGCHVVDLHTESIQSSLDYGFDHIEEVPRQGVTQGIHTIMKAKELLMMAKGSKKAELVKRMLKGEVSNTFPSSIIQQHDHVIVVLDEAAAGCLKEEDYERC